MPDMRPVAMTDRHQLLTSQTALRLCNILIKPVLEEQFAYEYLQV